MRPPTQDIDHSVSASSPHELGRIRAIRQLTVALFAHPDQTAVVSAALDGALALFAADGATFWVADADQFTCQLARGEGEALLDRTLAWPALQDLGATGHALVAPVSVGGETLAALRVSRAASPYSPDDRDALLDLTDSMGAALAAAIHREEAAPQQDLALVLEMSREIGSSLDLDRVLRMVANLAARGVSFDRGAVALYESGKCEIRAVAGAETFDANAPAMQDLAVRAAWAAGVGTRFYLSNRHDPRTDAERIFLQIFGEDLDQAGVLSALYLPLRDEEGVIGILVFEAERVEFATEAEQDLLMILANQAAVAIRNAQLYARVPMADALSALTLKRQALLAIPAERRKLALLVALVAFALLGLVRWPLRVAAADATFRPAAQAEVRALVSGVVEEVLVREGMGVEAGAPVARLRETESRAAREALLAAVAAAERAAAVAASRGDAATERLQRLRMASLLEELAVETERLQLLTLRAPVSGVVLTPRPEERVGASLLAGDALVLVGRTDSLELDFLVDQRDIDRVAQGHEVRLRVDAMPQRTFSGRVHRLSAMALAPGDQPKFPVVAIVPNPEGLLMPGMVAHARVLTAPKSTLGRLARMPLRQLRLFWWRIRP